MARPNVHFGGGSEGLASEHIDQLGTPQANNHYAVGWAHAIPRIPVGFTVPADESKTALLSIGAAIVPFIGIVFSLLFLVVQFGSTTFTPRLNLFRHSPIVWHAFSYFSAVFAFTFVAAFTIPPNVAVSTSRCRGWSRSLSALPC